jgi:hypothetical protein
MTRRLTNLREKRGKGNLEEINQVRKGRQGKNNGGGKMGRE